jgi:hypothetical protein
MTSPTLSPRHTLVALVALVTTLGVLAFSTAPALALSTHVFSSSFGSSGAGVGQVSSPAGVAVDNSAGPSAGDVYVADPGNFRVDEFSSSGTFIRAWGWGVADGLPSFETCTLICQAGLSGSGAGQFTTPTFVAVDSSAGPSAGDVYVGDTGDNLVTKFSSEGALESTWGDTTPTPNGQLAGKKTTAGSFGLLAGVAVDGSGGLLVDQENESKLVFRFAQDGTFATELEVARGTALAGLAVDATGDIFKVNGDTSIEELMGSGSDVGQVSSSTSAKGIAVDPLTGDLYAAEGDHVEQYVFPGVGEVSEPGPSTCAFRPESGCAPSDSFGSGNLTGATGIGVDPSSGSIYVADASTGKVDVFVLAVLPDASTGQASSVHPTAVTLNGAVDPKGVPVTACQFEYGPTTSYGSLAACEPGPGEGAGQIGKGTGPVLVSANVAGLQPNTEYHFRLLASNANGTSRGVDVAVTTTGPPRLDGEWVANVTSVSASFDANVNPRWPTNTSYRLEYGLSAAYGETVTGSVGEGSSELLVSVHRQDLQPGTTYHYRIVVSNVYGTVEGPDLTFTTQAAGGQEFTLPDGRAWELVSPPNKNGASLEQAGGGVGALQAASDGSAITYITRGVSVVADPAGKISLAQVLSKRGPDGWSSQDLTLPGRLPEKGVPAPAIDLVHAEYRYFSPDLSLAAVEPQKAGTPLLSPEATEQTLYLRNNVNRSFTPLVTAANVLPGAKFWGNVTEEQKELLLDAVTPDLSHVVFLSQSALTPGSTTEANRENMYEWGGGRLQLVSILPNDKPAVGSGSGLETVLAGAAYFLLGESSERAVSSDGRRVAWTLGVPYLGPLAAGSGYGGLYVRDMVEERTLRVGGPKAVFQTMNSEGSKIFFLENGDLYEFSFATDTQVDITAVHGAGESSAGVEETVVGVSEDGSSVYFVANGVLASGAAPGNCTDHSGLGAPPGTSCNLYVSHDNGGAWSTTYVATLSGEDSPSWSTNYVRVGPARQYVTARVSSDGRYLTFMSNRSLTGYDNLDASSGKPDEEVYLYDATVGRLVCASCNPTGARPQGVLSSSQKFQEGKAPLVDRTGIWTVGGDPTGDHWLAGSVPGWSAAGVGYKVGLQPRYLSDRGRLFFNSPDALVPQDTNGLEDVYQYEPVGVGGCTSASVTFSERSGGCVNLISAGTSSRESVFMDASEGGDDVFFLTASSLTAADYDTSYDMYDAHVCSSSVPCAVAPVSPPPCTSGDSCKAAPSPQPAIFGAAPSATFSGAGNLAGGRAPNSSVVTKKIVKCPRGKKLSHGRCIKTKRKKKAHKAKKATTNRRAKR